MVSSLLLGMALLAGVPRAGACGKPPPVPVPWGGENPSIYDKNEGPCRTIAAILRVYPALEVRRYPGPAGDSGNGSGIPGCRVLASGPASAVEGEVPPGEALRELLGQEGWEEDPRRAADGPGTTSFALRKGGITCFVSGGAPSGIDDGKPFTAEKYELEALCAGEKER